MTSLWIAIGAMTLGVLAALITPLLRRRGGWSTAGRTDYDTAVYKDQLVEIEREFDSGLLNEAEAEATRFEVKRRLLLVATDDAIVEGKPPAGAKAASAVLAIVFPIGAIGLYALLGSPTMPDLPFAERNMVAVAHGQSATPQMEQLVSRLAERLKSNPGDLEGWLLLGRSLMTIGRHQDAANAFKDAMRLAPNRADIVAGYAEARIFANDGQVTPEILGVLEATIGYDPHNPIARYYVGVAKAQGGYRRGALQAWVDLVAVSAADAPWLPQLRQQIADAAADLGLNAAAIAPSPGLPAPPIAETESMLAVGRPSPGPNREEMEAAAEMSAEDRAAMIRSMVERLAARLVDEPDDLQGWIRLERAYRVLGVTAKADEATKRIEALRAKAE